MIRHFRRQVDYAHVEDVLHAMYTGRNHVVLVEIYDHPESGENSFGDIEGPWVVGNYDEVMAWLETNGHDNYSVRSELGE